MKLDNVFHLLCKFQKYIRKNNNVFNEKGVIFYGK